MKIPAVTEAYGCQYIERVWIGMLSLAIFFTFPALVFAESAGSLVAAGNLAYKAGKYDEALAAYDKAAALKPDSPYIDFDKGVALYRKGDYEGAAAAFQQAALKSHSPGFRAKSKFNMGNSVFLNAGQQRRKDPAGALDLYNKSVAYYREALDLDAKMTEAAHNIEVARLTMKQVREEIKKRREHEKAREQERRKLADKLRDLAGRQRKAAADTKKTAEDKAREQTPERLNQEADKLAQEQEKIKKDTEELAGEMNQAAGKYGNDSMPDSSFAEAEKHMREAADKQTAAEDELKRAKPDQAAASQQEAEEKLRQALDALKKQEDKEAQGKGGAEENKKEGKKQDGKQAAGEGGRKKNKDSGQQANDSAAQPSSEQAGLAMPPAARTARDILNEEKLNRQRRQPVGAMGYQEVDKDW